MDPLSYWKLRAVLGDIDRITMQMQQLQKEMQPLVAMRTALLREYFGDVDLNFMTGVVWNDDLLEIGLTGASPKGNSNG